MNLIHKSLLIFSVFFMLFVQNSFSQVVKGTVEDQTGQAITDAYVILVYINANEEVVLLDWQPVNPDGNYQFTAHREYVSWIIGFPNDPLDYIQTYYPAGLDWSDAEPLYPNQAYPNADIVMQNCNIEDNFSVNTKHFSGSVISSEFLNSLSDIMIYVKQGNELLSYVTSDLNGNFELDLPYGSYEITASKFGYQKEVKNITVTNELSRVSLDFILSAVAVNSAQNFIFPTLEQLQIGKYNVDGREAKTISSQVKLAQNFPNPFNPETNISFTLPENANVQLNVYDISGKEVARLVNDYKIAGDYSVRFDASLLPTGIYIYKLNYNNISLVRKMMLIK